jgi:outer membrane protein assembly factor BamA
MKSAYIGMLLVMASAPVFSQATPPGASEQDVVVEGVECQGNTTIPCDFIRRKLQLPENSKVDDDAVQSAQLRLSALSNFESVRVYLQKGSEKGKAVLMVEVVEASPIVTQVTLGVQYRSIDWQNDFPDPSSELDETLTGTVSHQNLFGRQKLGELTISGLHASTDELNANRVGVSLAYIDPNLVGSERWFLSMFGAFNLAKSRMEWVSDVQTFPPTQPVTVRSDIESRTSRVALSIGYRLWDYSYLFARIENQKFHSEFMSYTTPTTQPTQSSSFGDQIQIASLGYGWDTEDDAYFPTRGSRLSATFFYAGDNNCGNCDEIDWRIAYKQTWMMGSKSVWTVNVGGEPYTASDRLRPVDDSNAGTLGLRYAYLLDSSDAFGGVRRGRWYIQLGTGPVELSKHGDIGGGPNQAHVTLGLRIESKVLGIVDLYATGSQLWPRPMQGVSVP